MYVVDGYKKAEGIGTFRFKSMTGEMKQVSVDARYYEWMVSEADIIMRRELQKMHTRLAQTGGIR